MYVKGFCKPYNAHQDLVGVYYLYFVIGMADAIGQQRQ